MQLDAETFGIADQFALGDDMIVAPVVERGARKRDVYLTAGTWRDAFEPVRFMSPSSLMPSGRPVLSHA